MMWHDDNNEILQLLNKVNLTLDKALPCPICNSENSHVYFQKHDEGHCGMWSWCSDCKAFAHVDGEPPLRWENPDFIDPGKLCAEPEYLDQMKDKIDEWVTKHIPADSTQTNKPFVMENKFNVCFKENYSTITAGTIGTLIIKDDFNSMSIFFIDSDNKKIKVDLSPEKLMEIVDVVK